MVATGHSLHQADHALLRSTLPVSTRAVSPDSSRMVGDTDETMSQSYQSSPTAQITFLLDTENGSSHQHVTTPAMGCGTAYSHQSLASHQAITRNVVTTFGVIPLLSPLLPSHKICPIVCLTPLPLQTTPVNLPIRPPSKSCAMLGLHPNRIYQLMGCQHSL